MLNTKGLCGAVVYYDGMSCSFLFFTHYFKTTFLMTWQSQVDDLGQFDDAAMNLAVALTAEDSGATIANHVEVCVTWPCWAVLCQWWVSCCTGGPDNADNAVLPED